MGRPIVYKMVGIVLVAGLVLPVTPMALLASENFDWSDQLVNEVLIARADSNEPAKWEAYLRQLQVVKRALDRGGDAATYNAVNRFMDMLEAREGGIPGEVADRLFDYCYEVTPAKFHDVSRHLRKYDPDRWWEEMMKTYTTIM